MKLVAVAALLEANRLSPETQLTCDGSITVPTATGKHQLACRHPHGKLTMQEALGVSCNVYFAKAARRLPSALFIKYARLLQLDQPAWSTPSGVFPNAKTQILPDPLSWQYVMGLSPQIQPTLLQLLRLAALMGTRGVGGTVASLSPRTWTILQEGMQRAVHGGTADGLDPENKYELAAKTGTVPATKGFQSWIIGYFPQQEPKYAFALWAPSGTSLEAAVPLAQKALTSRQWPGVTKP
jgi:cell division protein FtsI/penicillin-binding protein 2